MLEEGVVEVVLTKNLAAAQAQTLAFHVPIFCRLAIRARVEVESARVSSW